MPKTNPPNCCLCEASQVKRDASIHLLLLLWLSLFFVGVIYLTWCATVVVVVIVVIVVIVVVCWPLYRSLSSPLLSCPVLSPPPSNRVPQTKKSQPRLHNTYTHTDTRTRSSCADTSFYTQTQPFVVLSFKQASRELLHALSKALALSANPR